MQRYLVIYPGAVLTLAELGITEYSSVDDNVARTLTGIWISPGTANVEYRLSGGGFTFAKIDGGAFTTGNDFLELDEPFPPFIKFGLDLINHSGSTVTPFVTLRYTPAAGAGRVAGAQ